jgi:hypothetical protein
MNLQSVKTPTIVLHAALVALYALPGTAAPLPKLSGLFHRTPAIEKPQSVIVSFHNESLEPRELEIGTKRFPIAPCGDLRLRIDLGSAVRVYSSMNSQIDGATLLTVTAGSDGQEVAIK